MYDEHVFNKKAALKNFAMFTEKHLLWSKNKNAGFQSWNFIKKRLQHRFFPLNIAKFLRAPVLENIRERLFEPFPAWASNITSNMGIEEDIFSKTKHGNWRGHFLKKKKKKIQNLARWKKHTFSWCYWSFCFSLYLHCMPCRLSYIIKHDRSEGL